VVNADFIVFYIYNTSKKFLQACEKKFYAKIWFSNYRTMENNQSKEILMQFGKRVQRCHGCFIAYY